MMVRIILETEAGGKTAHQPLRQRLSQERAVSHAARALSEEASVKAIVVFTQSGNTARLISQDRPRTPILVFTPSARVYHQLALWWGVWPYCIEDMKGLTDELMEKAGKQLIEANLICAGDYVVIVGGLPLGTLARTNFVKLHRVKPLEE
jgi:pyruvate kinase